MGPVAQLVEQYTGFLEVKGSSSFQTCAGPYFSSCMLVLLRESCTVSWRNAKEIPIHQKHSSGDTSLTVHTPWQESIKTLSSCSFQPNQNHILDKENLIPTTLKDKLN